MRLVKQNDTNPIIRHNTTHKSILSSSAKMKTNVRSLNIFGIWCVYNNKSQIFQAIRWKMQIMKQTHVPIHLSVDFFPLFLLVLLLLLLLLTLKMMGHAKRLERYRTFIVSPRSISILRYCNISSEKSVRHVNISLLFMFIFMFMTMANNALKLNDFI